MHGVCGYTVCDRDNCNTSGCIYKEENTSLTAVDPFCNDIPGFKEAPLILRSLYCNVFFLILPADSLAGIFQAAGIQDIRKYYYWDDRRRGVCLEKLLQDLERAPEQSVVVLSASGHYPTGADLSQHQWSVITQLITVANVYFYAPFNTGSNSFRPTYNHHFSVSTAAQAFPFPSAACSGALLWRFRAGWLACTVLCIPGDGAPLCSGLLPLLWTIW